MHPHVLHLNGIDLCAQAFGRRGDPALLLIGGASSAMDWWETAFCERLAQGGRFVIRYDLRDTGQSTHWPAGAPGYAFGDLVDDAAALLDHWHLPSAHIAAISMGSAVAVTLALKQPARVSSLVLMATSPTGPGTPENGLPPMAPALRERFARPAPEPDWTDRAAVVEYLIDLQRAFAGTLGVDEAHVRPLVEHIVARSRDMAATMANHWRLTGDDEPLRPRLREIAAPTLVIQGRDDPLFPLGHGEAMAREIPGARLLAVPGMGHEIPPRPTWDLVIPAMLRHTAK